MEVNIENYIDLSGEVVLMDSLDDEKTRQISEALQEQVMVPAGYKKSGT